MVCRCACIVVCSLFAVRVCADHEHSDGWRRRVGRIGSRRNGNRRASSNSNTVNSSGGTGGTGGTVSGGNTSSQGGSATGISTGAINAAGTGNSQAAEVTVNYIQPSAPGGIKGLAAGVDPETNHYVNDNNVHYSGSQKLKNTPDVGVGGPASGPCNGFSGGVGVSVPGFAIGANASTVDKGCEARETARVAAMLGRMDIANAVLEHISVVEEALKAKAERDAAKQAAMMVPAAPARAAPAAQQQPQRQQQQQQQTQPTPSEMELETARLAEQQKLAVAALQRKATMDKVNDTISFTTAANQEKTPQQTMAEEVAQKQAEVAASIAKQQDLERQILALKAQADKPPTGPAAEAPPTAVAAAAAPAPAASPVPAPVASVPAPSMTGVAAPITAKPPQTSAQDNPQVARSPTAANGAPPMAATSSVSGARPVVTADNASSLLGFTNTASSNGASSISNAVASAPSPSDASAPKIAMKAATVAKDTKHADGSPSNAATKTPAPDSVSAVKSLLNLK